ncbi:MAG: DUF1566 domain-containing protein [Pseudomonadota bacterium]|nr:DUF1566 domain-containing protein [Pseudomonadota bacterium]
MKRVILKKVTLALATAGLLSSGATRATLLDRGSGMMYDDALNVTWLQDANFAKTSGYDADGQMTWSAANTWAANLVYHDSVRNVDITDWRLASNIPVGADWNYNFTFDGSTDFGDNITSPASELAYMYYVNLGLKSDFSPAGTVQLNNGVFADGSSAGVLGTGQDDIGLVHNLRSGNYWSGTVYAPDPAINAWEFFTFTGLQSFSPQSSEFYAWAVRPGDVAAVPEPEAYAMLLAGLGLLGWRLRRA